MTSLETGLWRLPLRHKTYLLEHTQGVADMTHYNPGIEEYATYTVYAIEDPRYHEVRFVGYTDDIYQLCVNLYTIIDLADDFTDWINGLYDAGYAPILHILEVGIEDEERAMQVKRYWTKHYHYVSQRDLPVVPTQDDLKRHQSARRTPQTEKLRRIKERVH
jgi:hypothetical protein